MKELQEEFYGKGQVNGFYFMQVFKSDYAYIYRKTHLETGSISYEVFKRVENTQFNCISYPRSNSFGVWAYDCGTLEKAREYYEKFNERGFENEQEKKDKYHSNAIRRLKRIPFGAKGKTVYSNRLYMMEICTLLLL